MPVPVNGPITQGFGPTDEVLDGPYGGYAHFNKGYDYGVPVGTPVQAVAAGTVVAAGDLGDGWGNSIKIRTPDGHTINYGHLSSIGVQVGQTIQQGQQIAASGDSGRSTGPHLSLDIWDSNGQFVDPSPWVDGTAGGASAGGGSKGMSASLNRWAVAAAAAAQKYGLNPNIFVAQIQEESGFDPNAVSPAGAVGIAQFMPSTAASLGIDPNDPYAALDAAAKLMAGYVKQYGSYGAALTAYLGGPGNVPSDGSVPGFATKYVNDIIGAAGDGGGSSNMPSSDWYTKYAQIAPEFERLDPKFQLANSSGAVFDPARNAWVLGAQQDSITGAISGGTVVMTMDEYNRYAQIAPEYNDLITEYQNEQAGTSLSDQINALTFEHNTDPRSIDAKNSADAYARAMDIRSTASGLARDAYNAQPAQQQAASDSFKSFLESSMPGSFGVPSANLPTQDELFQRAVATVSKGLPQVTPEPYYTDRTLTPPGTGGTPLSTIDENLGLGGLGAGRPDDPNSRAGKAYQEGLKTMQFVDSLPSRLFGGLGSRPTSGAGSGVTTRTAAPPAPPPTLAEGVAQLTGPNPTNSPFLPGYKAPAIAGSVINQQNPLLSRIGVGGGY